MFHSSRSLGALVAATVCVITVALAACSSSTDGSGQASASAGSSDSTVDQIERVLFGVGDEASAADIEKLQKDQASYEERVAQCMANAGFEYVPVVQDVSAYEQPDVDYFSRAYAEQFGFGYTTTLGEQNVAIAEVAEDPNGDYVNSLSPSEQEQYYIELYGDTSVWDGISSEEERAELEREQPELFAPSGCHAESVSVETRETERIWTTYGDELSELYATAEEHPLVQAPLKQWQQCMSEAGYTFTTPDDFDTVMDPYLNDLYASAVHPSQQYSEEELQAMTDEELNELWSQPETYDPDLLAEAQQFEIQLAVASWDCGMEELYDSYQLALRELQTQFIEAHLDELRTLVTG